MGSSQSVPVWVVSFTLGVTVLCYWFKNKRKRLNAVRFSKLHDVPEFTHGTSALVSGEWPSRKDMFDSQEPNFVDTSSLSQSCDTFPCHVIATAVVGGERHVIAHALLREGLSTDLSKFQKMLKAGVPVESVKQAMRVSGVDSAGLHLSPSDAQLLPRPGRKLQVHASSLVVKPAFRGLGLGKSMCAFALQVASGIGATQIVGGCRNELVPYYERLGMRRRTVENVRTDIPKVFLGNEMCMNLNDDTLKKAEQQLKEIHARFSN